MSALRKTVPAILFNARLAEAQTTGAGAALISALITQQFTTITKNLGRVTVSVSGGGKAYSFTAARQEDIIADAMDAWGFWKSSTPEYLAALLDSKPSSTTQVVFGPRYTGTYTPGCCP